MRDFRAVLDELLLTDFDDDQEELQADLYAELIEVHDQEVADSWEEGYADGRDDA